MAKNVVRESQVWVRGRRLVAHPMIRNNGILFTSTAILAIANYLLVTIATRTFAPGEYSQFGVALNLIAICLPVSAAMTNAMMRMASFNRVHGGGDETDAIQRTFVRYLSVLLIVVIAVALVAREPIREFFRLSSWLPIVIVAVIVYWLSVQGLHQAVLQEAGRYARISTVTAAEGIFRAAVGIGVMVAGFGMNAALAVYMLSALLATFQLPHPRALWTGTRASLPAIIPVLRDVFPMLCANIGYALLTSLDVVLCRRYLDPVVADQYVALAALAKLFLAATNSISAIAFVDIVKAAHRGNANVRPLVLALGMITALGVPFIAVCALFGPWLTAFVFGAAFGESGHLLWITAVGAFACSVLVLEVTYFNARQWFAYLPVFLIGCGMIFMFLSRTERQLAAYAATYACGAAILALIFLVPTVLGMTGRITLGRNGGA